MNSNRVAEVGEFRLIGRLSELLGKPRAQQIVCGLGDDAAVFRVGSGRVHLVSTDAFVDQYHFDARFYSWTDVGYKAMAASVSDIAAMNAVPKYATVALALPLQFLLADIEKIYEGLHRCARKQGVDIIGGDTTRSDQAMLSITVIGVAAERDVVYRSGGLPGDLLCVTGELGAADIGLHMLRLDSIQRTANLATYSNAIIQQAESRHLRPIPRTDVVKMWNDAKIRPHALIDISDGLAAELHHICSASGCGAVIEQSAIPVAGAVRLLEVESDRAADFALSGGDEYELLFAASKEDCDRMDSNLFTVIGRLTSESGVITLDRSEGNTIVLNSRGHDHFAG